MGTGGQLGRTDISEGAGGGTTMGTCSMPLTCALDSGKCCYVCVVGLQFKKGKEALLHAATWMVLKNVMLSETSWKNHMENRNERARTHKHKHGFRS